MTSFFLSGALCHAPLLDCVIGRPVATEPAQADDCRVVSLHGGAVSGLTRHSGARTSGCIARGLSTPEADRLGFWLTCQGASVGALGGSGLLAGFALGDAAALPDWQADPWAARWAGVVTAAAGDIMALYPDIPASLIHRRFGQMLTRAGARLRARELRPETESLRHKARPEDMQRARLSHPYMNYFAVEEHDLTYRRFDGRMSAELNRAIFISGDASIVLPYDPVRDRVMVIEQFRAGPYARGDANPWLIEAIAGRVDGGETPEAAALREAREEAGLTIHRLLPGPRYYPSPAAKAEYLYSFIGLADLPDQAAGLGGLAEEAEDIRSHVISFDRLMGLVGTGEVDNAPLLLLCHALQALRPALRAEAGVRSG